MIWLLTILSLLTVHTLIHGPAHLYRGAAWISQGIHWFVFGGSHDMTISARAWVDQDQRGWGLLYRTLNAIAFWQDDHCYESFLDDLEFALQVTKWSRRA